MPEYTQRQLDQMHNDCNMVSFDTIEEAKAWHETNEKRIQAAIARYNKEQLAKKVNP